MAGQLQVARGVLQVRAELFQHVSIAVASAQRGFEVPQVALDVHQTSSISASRCEANRRHCAAAPARWRSPAGVSA